MTNENESFYRRLGRIFASGPAIQRRVKGYNTKTSYDNQLMQGNYGYKASGPYGFGRSNTPFNVYGTYGLLDRLTRYNEFMMMNYTPEIARALDIMAEECVGGDDRGKCFHVYSNKTEIKNALDELFYDTLNVEFTLKPWIRNLCQNGDFFLYLEVLPDIGITNVLPMRVNEVEREEYFDKDDPYAVRFKWLTRGNKILENWQVSHFRILGNDLFLPYGQSMLESARTVWRCLCLKSDAKVWVKNIGYKEIKDINSGDVVISYDFEKQKTFETTVKECRLMGKQKIVKVKTRHREIEVTPNHGMLVQEHNGKFLYKKAEELLTKKKTRKIDKLVLPIIKTGKEKISFKLNPENYSVRLLEKPTYESKNIINALRSLNLQTSVKNVHSFLSAKFNRGIPYKDFIKLQSIIDFTDVNYDFYFKDSNKKSILFSKNKTEIELDQRFFKFFGFMLGDGWVKENHFGFAFGTRENENDFYQNLVREIFGLEGYISYKNNKKNQINFANKEITTLFRELGFITGFLNKIVPEWAFSLNQNNRIELVKGIFDADGCDNTNILSLSNKKLIEGIQHLAQQSGIETGVVRAQKIRKDAKIPQKHTPYKLWLNLNKINNDVVFENVISVTPIEGEHETYDLEVDHEVHNFTAEGVITHNTMYEDAMLLYRLVRAPERRVFYIDVGHIPPNEVPNYLESVKSALKSKGAIDRQNGREDMRYSAQNMMDDYYIPVRGDKSGTKIDTLSGGQHITATEDIEYMQAKLFASIQVPKPYLNYTENMSAKASLSQMDIRFSRTINSLQKIIISELNKIAMIHLYAKGFDGPDLIDFELKLSNPSSVALQQKLELWMVKFDLAGTAKDTRLVDEHWIQKNILELSNDEIKDITKGLRVDRLRDIELEQIEPKEPDISKPPKTIDSFNPLNYTTSGNETPENKEYGGVDFDNGDNSNSSDSNEENSSSNEPPIKATPFLTQHKRNRVRRVGVGRGSENTVMPDLGAMLSTKNKYNKDVTGTKTESVEFDDDNLLDDNEFDYRLFVEPKLDKGINSIFKRFENAHQIKKKNDLLIEEIDFEINNLEEQNKLLSEVISDPSDKKDSEDIETIEEKTLFEVFNQKD